MSSTSVRGQFFLDNWSKEKQTRVLDAALSDDVHDLDEDAKLFCLVFNAKENIRQVQSHKTFIAKSFNRYKNKHIRKNLFVLFQGTRFADSEVSFPTWPRPALQITTSPSSASSRSLGTRTAGSGERTLMHGREVS